MKYKNCEKCGTLHWTEHKCPDKYFVIHEELNGDDPIEIRAYGFSDAATNYAEHYNSNGDYRLMDEEATVVVKDLTGKAKTFVISAEQSIDYSAKEI